MAKVGLSAPWVQFYHEVTAFFKNDSEVMVVYEEENNKLKLYVDNTVKAEALSQLMPSKKVFGSTTLEILIIPSNNAKESTYFSFSAIKGNKDLLSAALQGNKAVVDIIQVDVFTNPLIYVVFKPEVIQYFNDSLGDIHGLCSTLNQEIAKDIFNKIDNVCYCTDKVITATSTISYGGTVFTAIN